MRNKSRKSKKKQKSRKVARAPKTSISGLIRPRTAEQYFAMSRHSQDVWDQVVQIPGIVRTQGVSLTTASKQIGLSPKIVMNLAKSAFKRNRNGRYIAEASDRLLRILVIPTKTGLQEIALNDSRQASLVGEFWNSLNRYLGPNADASGLAKFRKKSIRTASGKRIKLLTELNEITRQAHFGNLRFEDLYGRSA